MHFRLALLLASLQLTLAQDATGPTIETPPSVVQCQPTRLSAHGGTPPYFISVLPGGQPGAQPLLNLPQTSDPSQTWNVALPAGTQITLQVRDSQGLLNYAQAVTIQPNSDDSCLKGAGAPNPKGSAAPSPPPSLAGNTSQNTPPSTPGNSSSKPAPAGTSSPATTSPGASNTTNQTKGSPFTGSSPANSSSPAASNAPNSAASTEASVDSRVAVGGLVLSSSILALFA